MPLLNTRDNYETISIWDLAEAKAGEADKVDVEALKKHVLDRTIEALQAYRGEILKERTRQAEIKEKYGIRSLNHLIVNLDGDLISLYDRKNRGENVDIVIRNKEERKTTYGKALEELKDLIGKEKSLTMTMPRFMGIIKVTGTTKTATPMVSDPEIEKIGMRIAMEYERRNGRVPEDVSSENLGFDIRSKDVRSGEVRYIEVKARAQKGIVVLTQNEWFKARRFQGDYYLYAVMNASSNPTLYIIRNPAENLEANEKIEIVRYVVALEEIVSKADQVEAGPETV